MKWPVGLLLALVCAGCAANRLTISDAFPPGSMADPWVLQGEVWTGSFDEAAPALGDDTEKWREYGPTRAWLAIYCHETEPQRCLKVRCFAFPAAENAREAFDEFRPFDAKPFQCGDGGCWTEVGVLFHWGRLVFDIFGGDASWGSQVESSMLAVFIAQRMPAGAPDNPQ
jgi:hypothetical protein